MLEATMKASAVKSRPQNELVRSILFVAAFLLCIGETISASAQQQWERAPGAASDIAIASGRAADIWMIGAGPAEKVPGGYRIFRIVQGASERTQMPGAGMRIALAGEIPWVVTETGTVQRFDSGTWRTVAAPKAFDIGASAKGVWIAAEPKVGNDYTVYRWTGSAWDSSKGAGFRLDVDADGNPWVVNNAGRLHAFVGGQWKQFALPATVDASDVAVETSGAPWVVSRGGELWYFNKSRAAFTNTAWEKRAQSASAVAHRGGFTWYLGSKSELYRSPQPAGATASFAPMQVQEAPTTAAPKTSPLSWIAVSGRNVPSTAVIAGKHKSGANLAVCRADMGDGIHPGKVWGANCVVGWGSREVARPNYEVLSASPDAVRWIAVRNGQSMPANAVVAGKHKSGADLAVCRADMGDGIHPGKVWGANCNVGWGGKEVAKQAFDVLVPTR